MDIVCFLIEPVEDKNHLWKRVDTGQELTLNSVHHAPVGAMWRATWLEDMPQFCGPDGKSYVVMTPGGEWMIDGRASNCKMPDDNVHKCWVRHGEAPNLTVDKNGHTCKVGAGSIQAGNYHGYLRNGKLTDC